MCNLAVISYCSLCFFHTPAKSVCVENSKKEARSFKNENMKFQNGFSSYGMKPENRSFKIGNMKFPSMKPRNRNLKNENVKFQSMSVKIRIVDRVGMKL